MESVLTCQDVSRQSGMIQAPTVMGLPPGRTLHTKGTVIQFCACLTSFSPVTLRATILTQVGFTDILLNRSCAATLSYVSSPIQCQLAQGVHAQ